MVNFKRSNFSFKAVILTSLQENRIMMQLTTSMT